MDNNENILKAINIIHYNGMSISLNEVCMSHTIFQQGQVLQASIYGDMIIITSVNLKTSTN